MVFVIIYFKSLLCAAVIFILRRDSTFQKPNKRVSLGACGILSATFLCRLSCQSSLDDARCFLSCGALGMCLQEDNLAGVFRWCFIHTYGFVCKSNRGGVRVSMSSYFRLREMDGSSSSAERAEMTMVRSDECHGCTGPVVESVTPDEFKSLRIHEKNPTISPCKLIDLENSFAEDFPDYIVGSFSVPSQKLQATDHANFAFYMDRDKLVFIDEGSYSGDLLNKIASSGMITEASTAHCLQLFLKTMLADDMVFLSRLEDEMENIEERLLVRHAEIDAPVIMDYRRLAIRLSSFYQQLNAMTLLISDNENKLLTREETRIFRHIANLSTRLASKADTLKEYSLQLYEMQQTLIDVQQNSIMQVLTIVTVLLAPMTLVTGWFGMNLTGIPGMDSNIMWIVLLIVFFVCTGVLLLIFYRKKWL